MPTRPMTVTTKAEAAAELLRRRQARRSLIDFTRYTKPDYRTWHHHRLLAEHVDRLLAGEITRLMVFIPPQHGKSELVSRRLPAYAFGRNPNERIIACSHTDALSSAMNRDVQRIIDSAAYQALFPQARLSRRNVKTSAFGASKRTSDIFEIVGHEGQYRSAGVGGAITGMPCSLGIIDDPIKSREQADSPAYRQRLWEWYSNDFYSRLGKNGRVLLTHTRWHRDDLAGKLLVKQAERDADQWTVLNLPAIAGDEPKTLGDHRQPGEPLWPEFKSREDLGIIRNQDPRAFAALYQQDPAAGSSAEWSAEYFGSWIWCDPAHWPSTFDLRVVTVDPSKGGKDKAHDYSAIVFLGVSKGLLYVDASLERRPPHQIVLDTIRMCERYSPDLLGVEANQFQELLVDEFERVSQGRFSLRWPVFKIQSKIKKEVRIRRLGPYLVNRELRFKTDSAGCRILVEQLMDFPMGDHDDGPDALEMAVRLPLEAGGVANAG
jgi:predicted phage terminase large subunit-like protein